MLTYLPWANSELTEANPVGVFLSLQGGKVKPGNRNVIGVSWYETTENCVKEDLVDYFMNHWVTDELGKPVVIKYNDEEVRSIIVEGGEDNGIQANGRAVVRTSGRVLVRSAKPITGNRAGINRNGKLVNWGRAVRVIREIKRAKDGEEGVVEVLL